MTYLSLEAKEMIIARVLSRSDKKIEQIARENNIGTSTLYGWLKRKNQDLPLPNQRYGHHHQGQSQIPPLQHILAVKGLDEEAIGVYCRQHGIHSFQLQHWQDELMKHSSTSNKASKESAEIKKLREENKALKKELHRKDKALAKTSALLVLKKKADLIWGDDEDV